MLDCCVPVGPAQATRSSPAAPGQPIMP